MHMTPQPIYITLLWSSTCWEGGTEILSLLVCLTPVEGTFVVTRDSGSDGGVQ